MPKAGYMKLELKDNGFTILEVLVALTLLTIGILAITGLAGTAIKSSSYSRSITQANNLAQKMIEELMVVDFDNLDVTDTVITPAELRRNCTQTDFNVDLPVFTCTAVSPITVDSKDYTWGYEVSYINLDGQNGANPSTDRLKKLKVTISWTDQLWGANKSLSVTTLRSRR